MKRLFAICLVAVASMIAGAALADPFDEKLCTTILLDNQPHSDGCVTFHGFTLAEVQQHRARIMPMMTDAATKKSGGPYTVTLSETTTDTASGTKGGAGDMTFTGLSLKQAARLARLGFKSSDTIAANAEAHGAKGKRHPWGPKKD
jgi:hypothetical protein